jgi:hypothetical protein
VAPYKTQKLTKSVSDISTEKSNATDLTDVASFVSQTDNNVSLSIFIYQVLQPENRGFG